MKQIKARYFSGLKPGAQEISLLVHQGRIKFELDLASREYEISACEIQTPLKHEPLVIETPQGERIEILSQEQDQDVFDLFLNKRTSFLYLLENNLKFILLSFVLVIGSFAIFIEYGAPLVSDSIAINIPQGWANKLDPIFLKPIDEKYFKASELSKERQKELISFFHNHSEFKPKILFRKGGPIRANAFAFAGETMVFTDELVNHIKKKELLLSIYLHELGHLEKRHLLAKVVSVALVNTIAFFVIGDTEGLTESLANLGMTLISLKHSRDYEVQADLYSGKALAENNMGYSCFKNSFKLLQDYYKKMLPEEGSAMDILDDYLSSHPDIDERVESVKHFFSDEHMTKECEINLSEKDKHSQD